MSQHLSRSGPIVAGKCVFCFWCLSMFPPLPLCLFCFVWCLCRFGDFDFTKHWQAPKKNKKHQTTRSTKPAQAPKKKEFPASTQKWAHSCWKVFLFFFGACPCFLHFGFVFFWCLCRFGDSDFSKCTFSPKYRMPC